jgi:DNA-binding MarR family transcriptional regulator
MTNRADNRRISAPLASRQRASGTSPYWSYSPSSTPFDVVEVATLALRDSQRRQRQRFLKGPIPIDVIAAAARLPGKSLAVLLAIRHRADLTRSQTVALPRALMMQFGVQKDSKARALRALEEAGLVRVDRSKGQSPKVTLKEN